MLALSPASLASPKGPYKSSLSCQLAISALHSLPVRLPPTTLIIGVTHEGVEKRKTSEGGIAVLLLLPFDVDASGWGRRAATTCLAISAGNVGVEFFFSLGPPSLHQCTCISDCLRSFQQRHLGIKPRSTLIAFVLELAWQK